MCEASRIIGEQRALHPGLTVFVGGDFNSALETADRAPGSGSRHDVAYRGWVQGLGLRPCSGVHRAHSYTPHASRRRGQGGGSSRIDDWLADGGVSGAGGLLVEMNHESDHDPLLFGPCFRKGLVSLALPRPQRRCGALQSPSRQRCERPLL